MKRIVLIVLLTVCLIGMAYAQSNAKERALQGTWKQVYTKFPDGYILYYGEDYMNGECYITFDGNELVTKTINILSPYGSILVETFRVVGDVLITRIKETPDRAHLAGGDEYKQFYTLNGSTLIMHRTDGIEIVYHKVK